MLKKIRKSVFETNSSSMHSICVSGQDKYANYTSGVITVSFGDFGWQQEEYFAVADKLSYVVTAIQYYGRGNNITAAEDVKESTSFKWLSEMVQDYNGCVLELVIDEKDPTDIGYIDHQSVDNLDGFWSEEEEEFKTNMKELIFNEKYTIVCDNDNH